MKNLYIIFALVLTSTSIKSQTLITGNVTQNTTWTLAGSPYLITNVTVTINSNIILLIEPGVVVKHDHSASWQDMFIINGTLISQGTVSQPIVFTDIEDDFYGGDSNNDGSTTSPTAGDWGGIRINPSSGTTSKFSHCLFRFGGDRNLNVFDGALEVTGGAPSIDNCTFTSCQQGLTITSTSSFDITSCSFVDCSVIPIAIALNAAPNFSNIIFNNNKANGIGLIALSYTTSGASYTLAPQNIAGITNIPYIIYTDRVTIGAGVTLTIAPGVIIKHAAASFYDMFVIDGTLISQGTVSQPIVFTDIKDDFYGGDSNNDGSTTSPTAGDWGGIRINSSSGTTSKFSHCLFRFGGDRNLNVFDGALEVTGGAPSIDNCTFTSCQQGLTITSTSSFDITSCSFVDCSVIPIAIALNAAPNFSNIIFNNNKANGIGLIALSYTTFGASYTLAPQNIAGITNIPYIIYTDRVTIGAGVTLTIAPGVIIKHAAASFYDMFVIDGTLISQGTVSQPIVFTDIEDDFYGGDSNNDGSTTSPTAGDWGGIRINPSSGTTSKFSHCLFRFGGDRNLNVFDGALEVTGGAPSIDNCTFTSCQQGLTITSTSSFDITSCSFVDCSVIPIAIALNAAPNFSNIIFNNNKANGIGLIALSYTTSGASYTLAPQNIAGITNIPYIIYTDRVTIGAGVTLTIAPGVIIKHAAASFYDMFVIDGTLISQGTVSQPIVFTDIEDDFYGGDSNNDGSDMVSFFCTQNSINFAQRWKKRH